MRASVNEMKYYQDPDQIILAGAFPNSEIQNIIQLAYKGGDQIYWDQVLERFSEV